MQYSPSLCPGSSIRKISFDIIFFVNLPVQKSQNIMTNDVHLIAALRLTKLASIEKVAFSQTAIQLPL